jgi:hypothetical protein
MEALAVAGGSEAGAPYSVSQNKSAPHRSCAGVCHEKPVTARQGDEKQKMMQE